MSEKKIILQPPNLDIKNLLYTAAELRPYRKGGVRLDHQVINGKHIFHNYGHGGAGISLAYGSAFISAKLIKAFETLVSGRCAVIGAGIIGLSTAIELAKRGFNVKVYASKIPVFGQRQNLLPSQVAAGKWFPGGCDHEANFLQHEVLSNLSYDYYKECIETKKYQSIKYAKAYDNPNSQEMLKAIAPIHAKIQYHPVKINFGNQKYESYLQFETMVFNTPLFLDQLITEAKLRGIEFQIQKFNNLKQILSLQEKAIWNCTGLASKYLFNDQNMMPVKGHLLYFNNINKIDYIFHNKNEDKRITVYGVDDRLIIGISYLQDKILQKQQDEKMFKVLHENATKFFTEKSSSAKL